MTQGEVAALDNPCVTHASVMPADIVLSAMLSGMMQCCYSVLFCTVLSCLARIYTLFSWRRIVLSVMLPCWQSCSFRHLGPLGLRYHLHLADVLLY